MSTIHRNNHRSLVCVDALRSSPHKLNGNIIAMLVSAQLALFATSPALAEPDERIVENPPLLQGRTEAAPGLKMMSLQAPGPGPKIGTEKQFDLTIKKTTGKLFNPANPKDRPYDTVSLRSYVGTDVDPNRPFVAPSIEVSPGDTVRITLHNELDKDDSCTSWTGDVNTPHCFNGTNLHSHGLWVSPTGNSDNVLLSINPGVNFQYEYNIPPDHPAGTFWYHSHRHGSTALQVSSGMAGAIVVKGDRLPTAKDNGDIDTLLKNPNGFPMKDRVLVLQQIQYYCQNTQNPWDCSAPNAVGVIESYDNFGPGTWGASGRYTSINGKILPTFSAKAGEIERWRLIHAGVRDTINLEFRRLKAGAPSINSLKAADADSFIATNCVGDPIPYHVVATDGLTRASAWQTTLTAFQPGYRNDALVVFPEAGTYCVIDSAAPASATVSQAAESRQLLGVVAASPGEDVSNIHDYLTQKLIAAAEQTMSSSVKAKVVADLKDGLKLTSFIPHNDVMDKEITGKQELTFFIDTSDYHPIKFEVSNDLGANFTPKPYEPTRIDRSLKLGGVDEWTLQSQFVSHPFHIHVNPFQIVKILDPSGKDVSLPTAVDDYAGGNPDPQYPGLKNVWKDTLWIKSLIGNSVWADKCKKDRNACLYTIVVRTRYQRYIGEFVLHCHILDHEDQGMMQNVSIDLPNGLGGTVSSHH